MAIRIPCVLMRGGTSRGPFFLRQDLPSSEEEVDRFLIAIMGSPHSLQVDGIGGGHPLTSKVAIISPSQSPDADVDYLFAQVAVERCLVDRKPNCGNMLSAVGPFAIEAGLVRALAPETTVRIRNLNTGALVESVVQTPDGKVTYEGETAIDGVPGRAAPVRLSFLEAEGAATGRLLPTGKERDLIGNAAVTLIDGAMPMMLIRAEEAGFTGHESVAQIEENKTALTHLEVLRREAGRRMGLGDVSQSVIPKIGLVAPAAAGGTLAVRYLTPDRCHTSIAVTGAITIATSLTLRDCVTASLLPRGFDDFRHIRLEHPSGVVDIRLEVGRDTQTGALHIKRSQLLRTARRIFEGHLIVPSRAMA